MSRRHSSLFRCFDIPGFRAAQRGWVTLNGYGHVEELRVTISWVFEWNKETCLGDDVSFVLLGTQSQ